MEKKMIYDINLIPKSKVKSSANLNAALLILFVASAALLVTLGLYLPYQQKVSLKREIRNQEATLLTFTGTKDTYSSLQSQIEEVNGTDLLLDTIKSNNLKMTTILNNVENAIPKDIIISSMSLEAGMLTLVGTSPSYTEVAGFIVNLRKVDNVAGVAFMSASAEASAEAAGSNNTQDAGQLFNFTVYVKFNVTDAFTGLLALQQAAGNLTQEEVASDETN
jgi:Tfp pilus assembly protein PilN